MLKSIILFCLLFVLSCNNNSRFTKGENLFFRDLKNLKSNINNGNYLVFVLNKSNCYVCETDIISLCKMPRGSVKKIFVVSGDKNLYDFEKNNYVRMEKNKLSKYGLLRINGTVLFFKNGECQFIKSIDVTNIEKLESYIQKFIQNVK